MPFAVFIEERRSNDEKKAKGMTINEYAFSHLNEAREKRSSRELELRRKQIERFEQDPPKSGIVAAPLLRGFFRWSRFRQSFTS